jgi:hypothetical protein
VSRHKSSIVSYVPLILGLSNQRSLSGMRLHSRLSCSYSSSLTVHWVYAIPDATYALPNSIRCTIH